MKHWMKLALVPAALVVLLSGCASGLGSGDYERKDARRVYDVKMGVVEDVRRVNLGGKESGVGTVSGAAIGGIAGSTIAIVQEDVAGESFVRGDRVRMLESGGQARVSK